MAEPGADRVQVDSGLEKVAGTRVADRVRCDPPCGERRHAGGTALDEPVDPKPRLARISHTVTAEGRSGSVGAEFLPREQVEQEQAALRPCFREARVAGTAA